MAAIADSAAGYAALTLMPPGAGVLTTEFKIDLMAPAASERIAARGASSRPAGRSPWRRRRSSESAGEERVIALLTATLMTIEGSDGVAD